MAALAVSREDQIFVTSTDGIVIRQSVGEISRQKRASTGVKVMSLAEGTALAAAALVVAVAIANEAIESAYF